MSGHEQDTAKATYHNENDLFLSVVRNVKTNLIHITEDKLENILMKYEGNIQKKTAWLNPLSLFIAFIFTITTTTPKDMVLGIKSNVWEAIFYCAAVVCAVWFLAALLSLVKVTGRCTTQALIATIKMNEVGKESKGDMSLSTGSSILVVLRTLVRPILPF